jgi:hypothetical protein
MTTKTPPKREKNQGVEIMLDELKGMIPTLLIGNLIAFLGCVVYGLITAHDFRLYTGLLVGNTAALLNFYHIGVKAGNIARMKDARRARTYATASFFVRYIGAFAVFAALLVFRLMNPVTAVIPLFFPKIHYTVKAIFNRQI